MIRYAVGLFVALVSLMAMASATEASAGDTSCVCEGADPATPVLVMTADSSSVTVENVGTLKTDIGTGQIVKADGTVLKTLPFTVVLEADPFTFTKSDDLIPHNSRVTYPIAGVQPGDKIALKFNMGFRAKCTVS